MSLYLIAGLISVFLLSGCENEDFCTCRENLEYIAYGTSFGECLGYCIRTIKATDARIEFEKSGWELEGLLPALRQSATLSQAAWDSLRNAIDYTSFFQLDTVIGCPDCADGGAEWIEVGLNGKVHRTTFEYMNEPETVTPYIERLRGYLSSFD